MNGKTTKTNQSESTIPSSPTASPSEPAQFPPPNTTSPATSAAAKSAPQSPSYSSLQSSLSPLLISPNAPPKSKSSSPTQTPPGSSDIYYAITDPEKFRDESKELTYEKYSNKFKVRKKAFKHGFAIIAYAKANNPGYQDSTRAEQETGAVNPDTPDTPSAPSSPGDKGLWGGHFDLDTSSFITNFHKGTTDAHVHAYDDKYDVTGADFLNLEGGNLHNLSDDVPNGDRFKIIVVNPDLSPGARLVINRNYDEDNPDTWIPIQVYANIPIEDLPTFSLTGIPKTTPLTSFGVYFSKDSLSQSDLLPSNTGDVRSNTPGKNGEWRNGALTLQAVKVNADNSPAFT
ncbi:MAG: hypothetical protein P8J87_09755, partial [Verrucomicrobiales bacterium]|nr:hypothetical protein [Verrucomicrobiales bacterium]